MRVYTTKGGWDDCTPMNWPFNFKPASVEVTPQIVSIIKSPFPNPSVLAKACFWGGGVKLSFQEFCQSNVHVRLPMGPRVFTLGRTFSLLNCHPVLFVLRSIWPKKKKKKGERTPSCQIALPYYNSWLQIEYSGLDTTAAKTLARHESSRWWSYHAMFICFYNLFLIYVVTGQVNGSHF